MLTYTIYNTFHEDYDSIGYFTVVELNNVLGACLVKLLEGLKGEVNPESRACLSESLRDVLICCYETGFENVDCKRYNFVCIPDVNTSLNIIQQLLERCNESVQRKNAKEHAIKSNEGLDEEDMISYSQQLEGEYDLMTVYVDAIGQLLKIHGENIMPIFNNVVMPLFSSYITGNNVSESLQVIAICMLDDVIEYGGESAKAYIVQYIPSLIGNITKQTDNIILRQCSSYGIAQSLRKYPELCVNYINIIVETFINLVNYNRQIKASNGEDEDDDENDGTTENALFAIGIICNNPNMRQLININSMNINDLSLFWLRSLPLKADEQEAKLASIQLCDMIENKDMYFNNNTNILNILVPDILRIISEVFISYYENNSDGNGGVASYYAHLQTLERMKNILLYLQNGDVVSSNILNQAFAMLNENQRNCLQKVLN
jgi:hypothetical protein